MRMLVVEDDRLLNNTLCYNLDAAGYAVDSALTKSAASNFLSKQDYDLIVLDVNLPDGNGFDFCREVKAVSYTHLDVYKRQETAMEGAMSGALLENYTVADVYKRQSLYCQSDQW